MENIILNRIVELKNERQAIITNADKTIFAIDVTICELQHLLDLTKSETIPTETST